MVLFYNLLQKKLEYPRQFWELFHAVCSKHPRNLKNFICNRKSFLGAVFIKATLWDKVR